MNLREEKILETIEKSKEVFIRCEAQKSLCYLEFMFVQLQLIRKRWWIFQALLLGVAALSFPMMNSLFYLTRSLGIIGVLFVVLMIPELWKNKSSDSMQVEAACLYNLRQIYAARILLFGIVDVLMISIFCCLISKNLSFALPDILVHFLLPMVVCACICFTALCSKTFADEKTSILLCLLWSGIWWEIVMNEAIYLKITFPVWYMLFGIAVVLLTGIVYNAIRDCNKYWEVTTGEVRNH